MDKIFKNFFFVAVANLLTFGISALTTFFVPRYLGVENYGYFQLYVFYITYAYAGVLHFGWVDGILLRYGGDYYENLNKRRFSGQFWLYTAVEIALGCLICAGGLAMPFEPKRKMTIVLTGICILFLMPREILQFTLQSTNRLKECAVITTIEKITYLIALVYFPLTHSDNFFPMIGMDLLGKIIALVYTVYHCWDVVKEKPSKLYITLREARANIYVGIKLTFASLASLLIIGTVRLAIENNWNIETFSQVSLTLSVSNLLMVFIRAIATVLFPVLRRQGTEKRKLQELYTTMRGGLMCVLLGALVLYYPMREVLVSWLPEYEVGLHYMALLFPLCLFESKMNMLIETFMKTMRQEKKLLLVNVSAVLLSLLTTYITVYRIGNLDIAVGSIVLLLAFRCIFAEMLMAQELNICVILDIVLEIGMALIFIATAWWIGGITGAVIYLGAYLVYLCIKRNDLLLIANKCNRLLRPKS